jgi:hypothetical protein
VINKHYENSRFAKVLTKMQDDSGNKNYTKVNCVGIIIASIIMIVIGILIAVNR